MFCCNKRESPQFALSEVNSPRYEIAFIDLEFVDYSRGRTTFKWPFKGYLFFVQSVQDRCVNATKTCVNVVEMCLNIIKTRVDYIEAHIDVIEARVEARVHLIEARVHLIEARLHLIEAHIELRMKRRGEP